MGACESIFFPTPQQRKTRKTERGSYDDLDTDSHLGGLQVPSAAYSWTLGHWHFPSTNFLPLGHLSGHGAGSGFSGGSGLSQMVPSKMDPLTQHSKPTSLEPVIPWPTAQRCHLVSGVPLRLIPGGQQVPNLLHSDNGVCLELVRPHIFDQVSNNLVSYLPWLTYSTTSFAPIDSIGAKGTENKRRDQLI